MKSDIEGTSQSVPGTGISSYDLEDGTIRLQKHPLVEGLFRKAFDCLSCHAAMIDENGMIIAVNRAWRESSKEMATQEELIYEGVNYLTACERSEGLHATGGKSFAFGLRAVLDRQMDRFEMEYSKEHEGNIRWFLGRINGLDIDGLRYAFILHQDISDYKDKNNQSLSKNTQLPTLLDTVKSLVSMLYLQELLNTILIKLANLIRYNAAAVFTFEDDKIVLQAYQGPPLSNRSRIDLTPKERYPEIHRIVFDKQALIIQDLKTVPKISVEISELLNLERDKLERFHSWLFLPMVVVESQIGMMVLAYHEEAHFDHAALRIGELFANFGAIAIQNARLYELSKNIAILQERNRLAYELHDSIAQSLYSINLYTKATQSALELEKQEVAKGHLRDLERVSGEAVKDMRLMIFELNNQLLEEFGIAQAIQARFEAIEAKQGIKTDLKMTGQLDLSNQMEREVFGIILEMLIYIEKTTLTKALSIGIEVRKDRVLINISTDQFVDPLENNSDLDIARLNRIRNRVRRRRGKLQFFHASSGETEIRFHLEF